jgi:tetratricopeptide (TPR) repeat protein
VADALARALAGRPLIQAFRPVAQSLAWELGQGPYWDERGARAFLSDHVPFGVTSDGRASAGAARVLLASLQAAERRGGVPRDINVLELGVGLGLFARLFLGAFRDLCREAGADYYDRLCYVAADRSETMLSDLEAHGLLAEHAGRYRLEVMDALSPRWPAGSGAGPDGAPRPGGDEPLWAAFLNYVLDNLPFAVLRRDENEGGVSQLCMRTRLAPGVGPEDHAPLGLPELVRRAESPDSRARRELLPLARLFAFDGAFLAADPKDIPYGAFAVQSAPADRQFVVHSYGALDCLEQLLRQLHPGGFIFVQDYAHPASGATTEGYQHQWYGGSTAMGLNFPLLNDYFDRSGDARWVAPDADSDRICTRLLCRSADGEPAATFASLFNDAAFRWYEGPVRAARELAERGRLDAALDRYGEALRRQPGNWLLLSEAAEFLARRVNDYQAGLDVVTAALDLNPINPDAWNTRGDCLFYLGRVDDADSAFRRALALDPGNVLAHYNLVYTLSHRRDYAGALAMVAEALFHDKSGANRDLLLQRQREILARLTALHRQDERLKANRVGWSTEP